MTSQSPSTCTHSPPKSSDSTRTLTWGRRRAAVRALRHEHHGVAGAHEVEHRLAVDVGVGGDLAGHGQSSWLPVLARSKVATSASASHAAYIAWVHPQRRTRRS